MCCGVELCCMQVLRRSTFARLPLLGGGHGVCRTTLRCHGQHSCVGRFARDHRGSRGSDRGSDGDRGSGSGRDGVHGSRSYNRGRSHWCGSRNRASDRFGRLLHMDRGGLVRRGERRSVQVHLEYPSPSQPSYRRWALTDYHYRSRAQAVCVLLLLLPVLFLPPQLLLLLVHVTLQHLLQEIHVRVPASHTSFRGLYQHHHIITVAGFPAGAVAARRALLVHRHRRRTDAATAVAANCGRIAIVAAVFALDVTLARSVIHLCVLRKQIPRCSHASKVVRHQPLAIKRRQ